MTLDLAYNQSQIRSDGLIHYTDNTNETVIATIGVPVIINALWVDPRINQFTSTAAGRLTYIGLDDTVLPITVSTTAHPVSGNSREIGISIFINGSLVGHSVKQLIDFNDSKNTTVIWQDLLSTNDFVEVFVQNDTDTANVIVDSAILRIN